VGLLTDGRPHSVAMRVANQEGFWPVDGDLLLDQDPRAATTSGGLLRDTLQQQPQARLTQTSAGGVDRLVTTVSRSWATEGFVDTSAGRVVTRVEQDMRTVNDQRNTVVGGNVRQVVDQRQHTRTRTTSSTAGRPGGSVVDVVDDYPLAMTEDFSTQTQTNGDPSFTLLSRVDVALRRVQTGEGAGPRRLDDRVTASAVLVRDTATGANLAADGSDSERYVAATGRACFDHLLSAAHGLFTEDRARRACG